MKQSEISVKSLMSQFACLHSPKTVLTSWSVQSPAMAGVPLHGQRLPVRGCRDVTPTSAKLRRDLIARFSELARQYGFAEIEIPILERGDLFSAALGSTSDVVSAELFNVTGPSSAEKKDQLHVVLRPEGTAGAARAFAPRLPGEVSRLWYVGPMFRYERPQRLRLRQFTQIGVECLGDSNISSDVDCISLAHNFLSLTSASKHVRLSINTLGTSEDRKQYNADLARWLRPRYASLSPISRARFDSGNCMRILDSKLSEDRDAMRGAPVLSERVSVTEQSRFDVLQVMLSDIGVPFAVDATLVRGLDYYTSTAFEFVDASGRAICAGGRYQIAEDNIGVGFAAGLERLETENSVTEGTFRTEQVGGVRGGVAVIAMTSSGATGPEASLAVTVVQRLRQSGACALLKVASSKLGKAIGKAVREGAVAVVIVGPDEVDRGIVQIKLVDGSSHDVRTPQESVRVDEVVTKVSQHVSSRSAAAGK